MIVHRKCHVLLKKYLKNIRKKCHLRLTSTHSSQWKPTIGLEIHAQIAAESKLFSAASTNFNRPINSCVGLFDCATPGTMPVLNKRCVEAGVLTALALLCKVNDVSMFERKHYFYPDLPAGFQITQHKNPFASDGEVNFVVYHSITHKKPYFKSSKIKQIQLEQDSGRSLHNEFEKKSMIDLNRAGIPLMELVFEPDLSDGEEAAALVKELCLILQILGTCSCKMEEGALRVDANVSVSREGAPLGIRTELKNIGSVRAVSNAITYEIKRQTLILEAGGKIVNETRAWDPVAKETIVMREKEDRHDYRFMPEPNLPPLYLHVNENAENEYNLIDVPSLNKQLPTLPKQIRQTMLENLGVTIYTTLAIMNDLELLRIFNRLLKEGKDRNPQLVGQIIIGEILAFLQKHELNLTYCENNLTRIGEAIDLLQQKVINQATLRKLLDVLISEPGKKLRQVVEENNWFMISDEKELERVCLKILEKNPKLVRRCKAGKMRDYNKLMHEVAKDTQDCADMARVSKIMKQLLNES